MIARHATRGCAADRWRRSSASMVIGLATLSARLRLRAIGLLILACTAVVADVPGGELVEQWPLTDFTRRTVDLSEISAGGPPRDGIPAIDAPRFVTVDQAGAWLDAREPVIVLQVGDVARAYPLQILIWHEIVNDRIADTPAVVTFCPLCNAAIAFDRRLDDRVLDFGTTGRLRNSDLVMYDRQTESWWQQFTGSAIVGRLAGRSLRPIPSAIVAFETFRATHPSGDVLSRDTGHRRDYGQNPYRGYDRAGARPFLLRGRPDPRLPAMTRVLGLALDGQAVAYPVTDLAAHSPLNDTVGTTPIVVFATDGVLSALDAERIRASAYVPTAIAYDRRLNGRTLAFARRDDRLIDRQTGSTWNLLGHAVDGPLSGSRLTPVNGGVYFAFAWLAFQPTAQIRSAATAEDAAR